MLRAILLDCDGVIADTESLHLAAFQEVLRGEGIQLSERDYYEKYLGTDDRDCFTLVFEAEHRPVAQEHLQRLIARKAQWFALTAPARLRIYPGVVDFVADASKRYLLGVVSGALRSEVEMALAAAAIRASFKVIVGQEDVREGKPSPEGFLLAMQRMDEQLIPAECLVIEDSWHGVLAARRAGMHCLALTTTYPKEMLTEAHWVVASLAEVTPDGLAGRIELGT